MHEHEPGQIELKRYTSPESDHHARSLILKTKKKKTLIERGPLVPAGQ